MNRGSGRRQSPVRGVRHAEPALRIGLVSFSLSRGSRSSSVQPRIPAVRDFPGSSSGGITTIEGASVGWYRFAAQLRVVSDGPVPLRRDSHRSPTVSSTEAQPAGSAVLRLVRDVDQRLRGQALLALLLVLQAGLLSMLARDLFLDDSWLSLVGGREIWRHGIPTHDTLGVLTAGRPWIDQQWLGQLGFYAASAVGGLAFVFVLHLAVLTAAMGLAMATARRRGASALSVFAIALLAIFVAPWSWQPRAQSLAELLFAGLLALLLSNRDEGPRRRTLLVLPLLVLWANVHGSVLLGVAVVLAYAATGLAKGRRRVASGGSIVCSLLLLSPLCLVMTPYGLHTIDYYASLLGNRDLSAIAPEWRAPSGSVAIMFFLLATVAVGLVVTRRRRLAPFELAVFLITFGASLTAVRHFAWFALAMTMLLPPLLPAPPARHPTALGRWVAWGCVGAVAAMAVALLAKPNGWYEQHWPVRASRALLTATSRDPAGTIFVHGREDDWLMWRYPSLQGRIAYDARLELLTGSEIRQIVRFDRGEGPQWSAAAAGYDLVWINSRLRPELARSLARLRGTTVVYHDHEVTLLQRTGSRPRLRPPRAGSEKG